MKSKKGFTLFELTLSLAIISVIAVSVMTLTVATINGTYMRNIKYLCKSEYQNLVTCFACSDFSGGNIDNLEENLEFYYTVDCTYEDSIREKYPRSPVSYYDPEISYKTEDATYTVKLGYDSLFKPCKYDENCVFSIFMYCEFKDGRCNLTMKVNSKKGINLGVNTPGIILSKGV